MAFSEAIKLQVRRQSHHSCCLCKTIGVEVHHIVPQEEDGPDTIDNAACLCPYCHETYGANPTKRKMITEARDLWYEICAARYQSDSDRIDELLRDISFLKDQFVSSKMADALAGAIVERLLREGAITRVNSDGWPLPKLLERLARSEQDVPDKKSVDATYALIFGTTGDEDGFDIEFNETRDRFLQTFGSFVSRQYCAYLVTNQHLNWTRGHTEDELSHLLFIAFIGMILLLNHEDLAMGRDKFRVKFTEDGSLHGSVRED